MEKKKKKKIIISSICITLAVILLIPITYILYVVCSYYRVEDNLKLKVDGNATQVAPIGESLTLTTYNVGFGAYSADYSFFMDGGQHARAYSKEAVITNVTGALNAVKSLSPDFALFQEVDVYGDRSYHVNQVEMLKNGFTDYDNIYAQNYDSPYFLYPFHQPIGANRSGITLFSKYDIESSIRRSLPIENSLNKYLDLDRAYTVSVVNTASEKQLILYNVHLSAYTSDGTIADEQLKMLAKDMKGQLDKGNYVIAAGDFNKDLLGDSSLYFTRKEGDYTWAKPIKTELLPQGVTCHSGTNAPSCRNADSPFRGDGTDFVLSVDGVLISDNVELISCQTVDLGFAFSDHNPVKLEFSLKKIESIEQRECKYSL